LVQLFPEVPEYRMYYAQSLYKAGLYQPAQKILMTIDTPEFAHKVFIYHKWFSKANNYFLKVVSLQAAIKYETDDLDGCRMLVSQSPKDDPVSTHVYFEERPIYQHYYRRP
jgi:tetratricopeptide repeat protein 30